MDDVFGIGDKLFRLRTDNKYTLDYVAHGLGIPRSTYYDYEHGNVLPKIDFIHKVATFYNVDPMIFLTGRTITVNQQQNQVANGYIHQQHNVPPDMMERWMKAAEERDRRIEELLIKALERLSGNGRSILNSSAAPFSGRLGIARSATHRRCVVADSGR